MQTSFDNQGYLTRVNGKFGYYKDITLTKFNDQIYAHICDNSKAFVSGSFQKSLSKTISLKWEDVQGLRGILHNFEPYAEQIISEVVSKTLRPDKNTFISIKRGKQTLKLTAAEFNKVCNSQVSVQFLKNIFNY